VAVSVSVGKAGVSTAAINDQDGLIRSLRRTETTLAEFRSRVEKFRKRLFEIDPVTEKPRYGPKSQGRVRLLVARNDFLCSQYSVDFPELNQHQQLQLEQYRLQQLELQEQRQEQRRQEHLKRQLELQKQQEQEQEQDNEEQPPTSTEGTAANMNPDGSMIIINSNNVSENNNDAKLTPNNSTEASAASLLFAELQQQYELNQQRQQRQEASKEHARLKEEEEKRRRHADEEARRKALEAQQAAAQAAERAAEEAARTQRLHQQAEEARLRRRAQEEARKEAERAWLNDIQKGAEGVKHYLDILLQRSSSVSSQQQQGGKETDPIDPDRIIALQSLCTMFEQIQKNPEEVNKRKIKLSNSNFHRDVGRHEGGIKLLVAAGFRPTMLPATIAATAVDTNESGGEAENNDDGQEEQPEIAFLISKEPNLEHDMDGWMTWFVLNKATLEILQTELNKVEGSKRSRR
jgi:chemotaxis protein histidine kinase CheA